MTRTITVVSGVLILSLAACQQNRGPLGPDFGDSVRHNNSVHIINPRPEYAGREVPGMSGVRAAGAMSRYEKGETADLKIESTSKKASGKSGE